MKKRVGIARALMQNPELMLVDEPVSALDPATSHSIMRYLEELNKKDGVTVICSLHFLSLARAYADRIIALKDGIMVFDGPPADIDKARFREIYGEEAEEEMQARLNYLITCIENDIPYMGFFDSIYSPERPFLL